MQYTAEIVVVRRDGTGIEVPVAEVQVKGPLPLIEKVIKEFADNLYWVEPESVPEPPE